MKVVSQLSPIINGVKSSAENLPSKLAEQADTMLDQAKTKFEQLSSFAGQSEQKISDTATDLLKSLDQLHDLTNKIKTSVVEVTGDAVNTIKDASNLAADSFKRTTTQATTVLKDATQSTIQELHAAENSIHQTATQTKLVLGETLEKAEQLRGAIANSVQDVITTSVQLWMQEHPTLAWMVSHPIWAMLLIVFVVLLFWGFFSAVVQVAQTSWLAILKYPIQLLMWFLRTMIAVLLRNNRPQFNQVDAADDRKSQLLAKLKRLEHLRQEQDALLKEIESLLN